MCVGSDFQPESGPGGREISSIGAPSPFVHPGHLGQSVNESPKVGRGAKGRTPIVCRWDSGGFAGYCDVEALALIAPAALAAQVSIFPSYFVSRLDCVGFLGIRAGH